MRALTTRRRLLRSLSPGVVDGAIALALFVLALAIHTDDPGGEAGFRDPDVGSPLLLAVQTLPLAVRRRAPLPVLLVALFIGVIPHAALGYPSNAAGKIATLVAFFTVIERSHLRVSLVAVGAVGVGIALFSATTRDPVGNPWAAAVEAVATFGAAFLLGTFARRRREQSEHDAQRAARLEEERDSVAQQAIAEERTAIARELHDAVGHALNLIVIQASASRRVYGSQPQRSGEALAAIESAGRQALTDMDRMLGLLRDDAAQRNGTDAPPGVGQLPTLVQRTQEAGLPVNLTISGRVAVLPQTVDQSAYRIVQEALTNCLKHARASRAEVTVCYLDTAIEITVTDDGPGALARRPAGRGLIGMRERVRLFGGEFEAGGGAAGGFCVRAKLPLKAVSS